MKKTLLFWILFVFCFAVFGCDKSQTQLGWPDTETYIDAETIESALNDLAALALPCKKWVSFANFAILWTGLKDWNLMYYWVDEVLWFEPEKDWESLKNTCYRIAPIAMEISISDKWFKLDSVQAAENYDNDFLIEDYNPEFDGWKLDDAVKSIFSQEAFKVWQERDYWEHFPDYMDPDRKTFDERAMEYFNIKWDDVEEFISYYDNWAVREKWNYTNWMKEWTWTTYDEEWNIISTQEYVNWELVE